MADVRILDVTDAAGFARIPPCADSGFDHRSCDYWEDERRGSRAARLSWLQPGAASDPGHPPSDANPFAPPPRAGAANPFDPRAGSANPFAPAPRQPAANPFALDLDEDASNDNPFAPHRAPRPGAGADAPRKLQLLDRGLAVFGSYAKVLEVDDEPAAYCQFGPLSAYPRAQRVRDLYPKLPSAPLPAVITCIATTAAARRQGLARQLVLAVVDDLAGRGFSAIEAYPEPDARPDATSAATPGFWLTCGFAVAVDDDRFPVMRREL